MQAAFWGGEEVGRSTGLPPLVGQTSTALLRLTRGIFSLFLLRWNYYSQQRDSIVGYLLSLILQTRRNTDMLGNC